MEAEELVKLLKLRKFPVQDEKETQIHIERTLVEHHVPFRREWKIGERDIPDFFVGGGVVVEVKIKGRPIDILQQCTRYCQYDAAKALILITNKLMGFPPEINGKPCYVINMGKAWL